MKKRTSKLLSILLAFALIVSAGDVVRAEDVDEQKPETQEMTEAEGTEPETEQPVDEPEITVTPAEDEAEVPEPVTEEPKAEEAKEDGNAEEAAGSIEEDVQAEQEIKPEANEASDNSLETSGMVKLQANGELYGTVNSVTFRTKGTLLITANYTVANLNFGVFRDSALNTPVTTSVYDRPGWVSASTRTATKCFSIPQAGTYYIGVYTTDENVEGKVPDVKWGFYDGSDRALSNGQAIVVGQRDAQTNYFAFKATSTGYIRVQGSEKNYRVALYNSSKSSLSGESYLGDAPTYGVKAGVTYYIRVTSSFNSKGAYTFQTTNTKISGKFGKTKKKAVTVKKKKKMSGYIEAGKAGKAAKWYKFKLTKKQKVNLSVEVGSNEAIKITVYKGKKVVRNGTVIVRGNGIQPLKSRGKWSKGTYYIKVQRYKGTSSGYYKLSWK